MNGIFMTGKTCMAFDTPIPYRGFHAVGEYVCTCLGNWFKNAFCAKRAVATYLQELSWSMCVDEGDEPK
jgi:hypothetical protein